jgi:hypothetical protein
MSTNSGCDIYYTRHCNTISNLFYEFKQYCPKGKYRSIENPSLSNLGIIHGLRIFENYHLAKKVKPHVVCGSYYVRTWETAFILYNSYFKAGGALYVLPYIHEYNDDDNNKDVPKEVYEREYKYYNVRKCLLDFMKFIDYLKEFIKERYPHLYPLFTFKFPKIIFMDKYGNRVEPKDAMNLEFYKKHIYLYNPNMRIFETRIFPKFYRDLLGNLGYPQGRINVAIVIHGKLIKTDLIGFFNKKDRDGKVIGSSMAPNVDITRKVDDKNYLWINNCDTFLKRYHPGKEKGSKGEKGTFEKGLIQTFPSSQREIQMYDNFMVKPLGRVNMNTKFILDLMERKVKFTPEVLKILLGIYYRRKYIQRFQRYLEWMNKRMKSTLLARSSDRAQICCDMSRESSKLVTRKSDLIRKERSAARLKSRSMTTRSKKV